MVTYGVDIVGEPVWEECGDSYQYIVEVPNPDLLALGEESVSRVESFFDTSFEEEIQLYALELDGKIPGGEPVTQGVTLFWDEWPPAVAVIPDLEMTEHTLYHELIHVMRHQEMSEYPFTRPRRALRNIATPEYEKERIDRFYDEGFSEWGAAKLVGDQDIGNALRDTAKLFYQGYEEQHGTAATIEEGLNPCYDASYAADVIANSSYREQVGGDVHRTIEELLPYNVNRNYVDGGP